MSIKKNNLNSIFFNTDKKAQLTLFILIGTLLVVAGVVYFIFSQTQIFENPKAKSQEQVSEIITFCVNTHMENAVKLIQFKGGRIDSEPFEDQKRVETYDFDIYSWDAVIEIEDMEKELEEYVKDKSVPCLIENLRTLTDIYDIEGFSTETFELDVSILDGRVETLVTIPLVIKLKTSEEIWEYSSLNLDLSSALFTNYNVARAIYLEHQNNYIFEDLVLEQISAAKDYTDPQTSIPTFGFDFSCSRPIWRAQEIQYSILSLNENNFKFLQFNNTKSIDDRFLGYDESIKEYYSNIYFKNLGYLSPEVDARESEVNVVVPKKYVTSQDSVFLSNFRTFLVNDEDTDFIEAKNMEFGGAIPIPCMQVYSKIYDLDYDILVEVESFQNQKLEIFRLPIRIQIEDSEPKLRDKFYDPVQNRFLDPILDSSEFTRTQATICAEDNRDYEIDLFTFQVSSEGLSPLYDVDVSLQCAGIVCEDLGTQTTQLTNDQAFTRANLPFCSRGKISAFKEGFYHVDTNQRAEILGVDDMCSESFVNMNEMNFNGNIPYLDICLIKEKIITLDVSSSNLFDIDRVQTIFEPRGEMIVIFENEQLDISSFAYMNLENNEMNLEIMLPEVESLEYNISLIYYQNNELLSYYQFENQMIEDIAFYETVTLTMPVLDSGIESVEEFDRIEQAYLNGFLDVGFGYQFN